MTERDGRIGRFSSWAMTMNLMPRGLFARTFASSAMRATSPAEPKAYANHVPDIAPPPQTHGIHVATLQLKSHHAQTFDLDFFADFAMRAAHAFQIPTGGVAMLPIRTTLWTVPRGPFVHKKSQENFWRRIHRRSIKVYDASDETVERWLHFLRVHEMPGIASKVQLFRRYPLGVGRHMESAALVQDDTTPQDVRAMAEQILRAQKA